MGGVDPHPVPRRRPTREHQSANRPDVPVNHVDIAPMSLGLCGIPVPEEMEGTDYSRLITPDGYRPPMWDGPPDSAYLSLPTQVTPSPWTAELMAGRHDGSRA